MKKIRKQLLFSVLLLSLAATNARPVKSETIQANSGNRIHYINTKGGGGSDAIVLESNGHFALIDMGEDYDFPDGSNPRYPIRVGTSRQNELVLEDRLFRHLSHLGVKKFDFILGTHVHSDHIGAADEVLKRYPVGKLYLKKYTDERITSQWRLWDNLFNYDNAIKTAKEKGVPLIQDIKKEDSRFKFGDMDIQLYNYKNEYGPDGKLKRVYDDNSNSLVAVVTVAGKKIYLGGDLDNAEGAEDKIGPEIGKVDMMKWNHHYEATISNTLPFLDSLSPSMVVHTSSNDANLASTREYLKQKNIQVVHASSQTKDATVFNISDKGFTDVSDTFPNIPTVTEKWYKEDDFWKYRLSDDQMAIGWHRLDDGDYYFFNGKGQMQAGRWLHMKDSREKLEGNWYYLNSNGKMQTQGWFRHDDAWYYISSTGARLYDQLAPIGSQKYLFDKDGKMLTGLQVFQGQKMFFASNGALQANGAASSWQKLGSSWYYYNEDGIRTVGLKQINGTTYYFDNNGVMKTGWSLIDGHWNYFTSSGAMKTGWLKDKDTWYYLNKEGIMQTGFQEIEGTRYYLNVSGAMQIGWKWLDNHYYYFASSGAMKTGWLKDNGLWYYLDKEGIMQTGLQEINGSRYYLNASGAMETGWKQVDGNWYYFQTDGSLLRNGTSPDGYKLNADGIWTTVTTEETTQGQTVANSHGLVFETTEVEKTQKIESPSVVSEENNQSTEPKTQTIQEKN